MLANSGILRSDGMEQIRLKEALRAGLTEARRAPRVLLALFFFCVVVAGTEAVMRVAAPELLVKAIPIFGSLPGMHYGMVAIPLGFALFSGRWRQRRMLGLLILMLLMKAVLGVVESRQVGRPDFANPYLAVSPWRPVWGVVVPLAWVMSLAGSARRFDLTGGR